MDSRPLRVNFRGEASIDGGGPFREFLSNLADEFFSKHLPLCIPTSNNKSETGFGRDLWTLNPDSTTDTHKEMFKLFGAFIGFSARTSSSMHYRFPIIFYKKLLNEKIVLEDFITFDNIMIN